MGWKMHVCVCVWVWVCAPGLGAVLETGFCNLLSVSLPRRWHSVTLNVSTEGRVGRVGWSRS